MGTITRGLANNITTGGKMHTTGMPTGTIIKTTRGTTGNEQTGSFNISATSHTDTTLGFTINKSVSSSYLVGTLILSFGHTAHGRLQGRFWNKRSIEENRLYHPFPQ